MHAGYQREIWANGVGDDWLERNREQLGSHDEVSNVIEAMGLIPTSVLEVGCSNGWRLHKLQKLYGCTVAGIDVSAKAIKEAQDSGLPNCYEAGADAIPFPDDSFDVVIFGFCLCFVGPEDWLSVVRESDRVLKDGGYIIIYDFLCTDFYKRRMVGILSDKEFEQKTPTYMFYYQWPKLWLGHPSYSDKGNLFNLGRCEVTSVLVKNRARLLVDINVDGSPAR